jgi:hypothetical protein
MALEHSLAELLTEIVAKHRDVMLTFAVRTDAGQQPYQMPLIKPLSVRQTKEGHHVITGYNLRRLPDDATKDISSRALIRSFRIDRIIPHTLQFLYPALPPELYSEHPDHDHDHDPHPAPDPDAGADAGARR